jgi:hypothetical protein
MTGLVPLIAADIGNVIGLLVFIVIVLLSVAGQIMNKAREGQQKGPPQRPGPRPQPQPRQQQGPVVNEIDQFVRQAAQRPAEGGRQPVAQRPGGRPQSLPRGPAVRERPVEAVPVELLEPIADDSSSVAEHVRTHAAPKSIGTVGSRKLESEVAQADENLEERVHELFDHKLGRLSGTPGETAEESGASIPPTAAAGMAAMLTDPASIRQAIVLSEILQRPEHRWG